MNKSFLKPLPKSSSVIINDCSYLLLPDGVATGKSVYVNDKRVQAIGERDDLLRKFGKPETEITASGCIVMPGLVNNHSHIAMSLLRGYAEDLPLLKWLREKVWPAESKLEPEDIYLGAVVGAIESALSGTTSITSIYFYDQRGSEAEALFDIGLRGTLAHGVFDWTKDQALSKTKEFVRDFHGLDDGRIRIATSPHAPYSCSPSLLKEIEALRQELNEKYGTKYPVLNTLHVAEARNEATEIETQYKFPVKTGVAAYLDSLHVLNTDTIAAHSIHLTEHDIVAFARTQASIASCPISNLKVGMGVADLPKALDAGIVVSLGTDGPASNNTLDMFETMKLASLLPKGVKGDTTLMSARKTFELATQGGARSLHQQNEIGSLNVGKKADIIVLDVSGVHSMPLYDPYNHIVFSAKCSDVRDVMIDGRIIVRERNVATVDVANLQDQVKRRVRELGFAA